MLDRDHEAACETCHNAPADRLHRQFQGGCKSCHRTEAWKPATFDHNKFFVLDRDHEAGEHRVRELMHLLMAWEYLGDTRRAAFEVAARSYVAFYLDHMRVEETQVLPAAERALTDADWHALNAAFATNQDPLNARLPRHPQFDRLFTRIVMLAPSPVGVGS